MSKIPEYIKEAEAKGLTLIKRSDKRGYFLYTFNKCKHQKILRPSSVKTGTPLCNKCILDSLKKEAQKNGLTLIKKHDKKQTYVYIFNKCKHEKISQAIHVKNNNLTCDICNEEKLKKEANIKGLVLIGKSNKKSYYIYKFNQCNHEKLIQPSQIRQSQPLCDVCYLDKLKEEALVKGLTLVDKNYKKNKCLYFFNKCGHEKVACPGNIRRTNPTCDICQLKKIKKEADEKDLILISQSKKSGYYIYKFKNCNHEKEYTLSNVRDTKNIICNTCKLKKLKKEAIEKGLNLLQKAEITGSYIYKFEKCGHKKTAQPHSISSGKPICEICQLKKLKKEAKEKGLNLLKKAEITGFYIYKFEKCGHEKTLNSSGIKFINNVYCYECQLEKLKKEAKEKELTLIKKLKNTDYNIYKFDKCGHEVQRTPSCIRNSQVICRVCNYDIFKKEAEEKGLTLIKKIDNSPYNLYIFNKCGHKKKYQPYNVSFSIPVCNICNFESYKKEADKRGLELIKQLSNQYYLYKFKKCGHKKRSTLQAIRNCKPVCEECGESHFNNESFIYLIKIYNEKKSFLKLGVAWDVERRIKGYRLDKSYNTEILDKKLFDNRFISTKFEKIIHKKYKLERLSPNKMKDLMNSGYTECYPLSLKDTLLSEIDNFK